MGTCKICLSDRAVEKLLLIQGLIAEGSCVEERKMLEGRALIQDTDMPLKMQLLAMTCASQALDIYDVCDCTSIAGHIKKVNICDHQLL